MYAYAYVRIWRCVCVSVIVRLCIKLFTFFFVYIIISAALLLNGEKWNENCIKQTHCAVPCRTHVMHAQYTTNTHSTHDVQIVFGGIAVSLLWCEHIALSLSLSNGQHTRTTWERWKESGRRVCVCVCVYSHRVWRVSRELCSVSCLRSLHGILATSIHISTTGANIRRNISSCVEKTHSHACMYIAAVQCMHVSNAHSIHFTFTDSLRTFISTMLVPSSLIFPFSIIWAAARFRFWVFHFRMRRLFLGIFSKIKTLSLGVHFSSPLAVHAQK